MTRVMHFTIGPVQGFIEDAKRTRDLWAGSFLLSLLAGHAMAEVLDHRGQITFPETDGDPLLSAIRDRTQRHSTYVGTLPNRFKADVTNCPNDIGQRCRDRVQAKWTAISDAVRSKYLDPHAHLGNQQPGNTPGEIWDRQVGQFWDIAWVTGDDPKPGTDGSWLDQRKNWRSHYAGPASAEDGDHCRLMGEYQEISGYHRTYASDKQRLFWTAMSAGMGLDLSADEPLCAIALVKRLFPHVGPIAGAMDWQPGETDLDIIHWPSVSYLAAVPWLEQVVATVPQTARETHSLKAKEHFGRGFLGETDTHVFRFDRREPFLSLDGHLFHKDGILGATDEMLAGESAERKASAARALTDSLTTLAKSIDPEKGPVFPSEFYAILKMDGDGIGKLLQEDTANEAIVKAGLARFSASVVACFSPGKTNQFSGVLIYAGGDDVLALLPLNTAISAALHLRREYDRAFEAALGSANAQLSKFTLSGAIVFSHYKIPLRAALAEAGRYLDKVAKEKNGRDSLAIAVMKPGGIAADWVSVFRDADRRSSAETLLTIARTGLGDAEQDDFSRGFFHSFKARYLPLFYERESSDQRGDGVDAVFAAPDFVRAILVAEYKKQFGQKRDDENSELIEARVDRIMHASTPLRRQDGRAVPSGRGFDFDAGLVIRFLANEGRWPSDREVGK
jgi:CRISPR-associated protein Cmr2